MIRTILISLFSLTVLAVQGQRIGEWTLYPATYNTTVVAEAPSRVYAVCDGTLYSYGKEDGDITFHTRQEGLSDTNIQWLGYNAVVDKLLIVYRNGNIDLMGTDGIYNLPYLKNAVSLRAKEVNGLYFRGTEAYLSTGFGVVVVEMARREIVDTYRLNRAVYSVCIDGDVIYASSESGLLRASLSANLSDASNWSEVSLDASVIEDVSLIRHLCIFQGSLCMNVSGKGIYYLTPEGNMELLRSGTFTGIKLSSDRLMLTAYGTVFLYASLSSAVEYLVMTTTVQDVSSLSADTYWLACGVVGLVGSRRVSVGKFESIVSDLSLDGPKRNLAYSLTFRDGVLWVAGGGRSRTNRLLNPGTLMRLKEGRWLNFDETAVRNAVGYACQDYTSVAVDPADPDHIFVGSCGEGVLEFRGGEFVRLYNHANSSLQTAIPSQAEHYVRVESVSFDAAGNLWVTNSNAANGISIMSSAGEWTSLYYPGINAAEYVDQILTTRSGNRWVNVPHSGTGVGILVFNDGGTPFQAGDDYARYFTSFRSGSGSIIDATAYYCMIEDQAGEVWLGTDKGPVICAYPDRALTNPDNLYVNYIVRTNESDGEPYYFLNGEEVHAMAVDGGNRKWIGTSGSGVFLVSADGSRTLHHFHVDNSPLPSNSILSLAIDDVTGEVYIGTDAGLVSYRAEATSPSASYADIYAYPNPVRLQSDAHVVITGLMQESSVKITDISGNLIYQGTSAGGRLLWDCRNHSGRRVSSGIYLVLCATSGGTESVVTKIVIVN